MRHSQRRLTKPTGPFEFSWKVPAQGHRLVRARLLGAHRDANHQRRRRRSATRTGEGLLDDADRPVLCLTDGVESGQPVGRVRRYKPLATRFMGLFLEFAATPRTEAGILTFANRNGSLFGGEAEFVVPTTSITGAPVHGEALGLWDAEISAMEEAVELKRRVEERDRAALGRLIKW